MLKALLKVSCMLGAVATQFTPFAAATAAANGSATTLAVTATCGVANADAAVAQAMPADIPTIAREMGKSGVAYVKVDLASSGAIAGTSIFRSSGNAVLDQAALSATRWSSFRPEIRNCAAVSGSYLYAVEFDL